MWDIRPNTKLAQIQKFNIRQSLSTKVEALKAAGYTGLSIALFGCCKSMFINPQHGKPTLTVMYRPQKCHLKMALKLGIRALKN